jgi:hypothetical protein
MSPTNRHAISSSSPLAKSKCSSIAARCALRAAHDRFTRINTGDFVGRGFRTARDRGVPAARTLVGLTFQRRSRMSGTIRAEARDQSTEIAFGGCCEQFRDEEQRGRIVVGIEVTESFITEVTELTEAPWGAGRWPASGRTKRGPTATHRALCPL